jgi:signal transduction histidine kinase
MTEQAESFSGRAAARKLVRRRTAIFAEFEQALRTARNPILQDEEAFSQLRQNVDDTLSSVISELVEEDCKTKVDKPNLPERIGISRVRGGIHPDESIRAAELLFDILVASVQEAVDGEPDALWLVGSAVRVLNREMMTRIRSASVSYASYLLDSIHQEHINERARIARELHDRIGNGIEVVYRQVELAQLYLESQVERSAEILSQAETNLQDSLENMRLVIAGLRLTETDRVDVALREYIDTVMPENVTVVIEVNGDEQRCGDAVRGELLLIVREALRNAVIHASPESVYAKIDIHPREVWVIVEDDGIGFDQNEIPITSTGLASIGERLALLDGHLKVESIVGQGTRIMIRIPLPDSPDC